MVDLAKLRKKAKKKAEGEEPQADVTAGRAESAPAEVAVQPLAEQASTPKHVAPHTEPSPETSPAPHKAEAVAKSTDPTKLDRFMAEAGRKREEAIATAAIEVAPGAEILELLTFILAGEQYAVDIETIVEIVRPKPLTRIPNAEESIVGIMSLRGTIVTLVDARIRLGHRDTAEESDETRVIVIDRGGEILGFSVDRVLRVVKVGHNAIEPHPVVHASEHHEAIRGVFKVANALTILLDLDKLLDHTGRAAAPGAKLARVAQR